jgi:hypothetical protein
MAADTLAGANEMAQVIPLQPRRHLFGGPFSFLFAGLGILIGLSLAFYWGQFPAKNLKRAATIQSAQIQVIDGDTIRANGRVYRASTIPWRRDP